MVSWLLVDIRGFCCGGGVGYLWLTAGSHLESRGKGPRMRREEGTTGEGEALWVNKSAV